MRAQLIELTPDRPSSSRKARSPNSALTIAWQSSNAPSMAIAWTLGLIDRRHLPPLHVRDAAVGEQDEDVGARQSAEGLNRRRARVAGGRAENRRPAVAPLEGAVHQPPQPLHGEILEGEGRPVEQLEQEEIAVELGQRRGRGVAEAGVGVARQTRRARRREILADERRDDAGRRLGVGQPGEGANRLGRESPVAREHTAPRRGRGRRAWRRRN